VLLDTLQVLQLISFKAQVALAATCEDPVQRHKTPDHVNKLLAA
jgi:hypothetical protein